MSCRESLYLTARRTTSKYMPRVTTVSDRALRRVGVDLVAEGILVGFVNLEAELVLVATLAAAAPMPIVGVRGLRHAHNAEMGVRSMAEAGLVHCTGTGCSELARTARLVLGGEGSVRCVLGKRAFRCRRRVWLRRAQECSGNRRRDQAGEDTHEAGATCHWRGQLRQLRWR